MAKKKTKAEESKAEEKKKKKTESNEGKTTEQLIAQVQKEVDEEYGKGVMLPTGEDLINKPRMVIPIGAALNLITGGGLLEGSILGITGNTGTCKTSTALTIAATCQRPEYGGRHVYWGKVEGRLSKKLLLGTRGFDIKKFQPIWSTKKRILSAQDHLAIYLDILKTVPKCVLVIDSISALTDEREITGGIGTELRGTTAKLISQFIQLAKDYVRVNDSILIGITHQICNTSGMGSMYSEKAPRHWGYQCDVKLQTVMREDWKASNSVIGQKIKWKCTKCDMGPPNQQIDSYVRYGVGIDSLYEAFEFGRISGIIKKSGSWYSLDYLLGEKYKHLLALHTGKLEEGKAPQGCGGEGVYALLMEHPEWATALEQEVTLLAGGCVGTSEDEE